jgi:hypothetical protein
MHPEEQHPMRFHILSDEQLSRLHEASLHILEKVGVQVPHAEVCRRFTEAGAQVDNGTERVRIPEAVVEKSPAQGREWDLPLTPWRAARRKRSGVSGARLDLSRGVRPHVPVLAGRR